MEMTEEIKKTFTDCVEEQGMCIEFSDDGFVLSGMSDAGEDLTQDFVYDGTAEDFIKQIYDLYRNYDVDEHVDLWAEGRGTRGIPNSYSILVRDAEEIGKLYDDLAMSCIKCGEKIGVDTSKLFADVFPREGDGEEQIL